MFLNPLTCSFLITTGLLLLLCGMLHLIPRLGAAGRRFSDWLCHAPGLDGLITLFTVVPLILGPSLGGWGGLIGAILGMYLALIVWTLAHELVNPTARRGPRIVKIHNRVLGTFGNMFSVWVTSLATPIFWMVRLAEVTLYPVLVRSAKLPRYRQRDWVNVSRHKFAGLVGHDRIWCLYCDWMTGIWSLGGEMLRNVESFWCPIRFRSDLKCENCRHDFPDIEQGWVDADSTMVEAAGKVEAMYATDPRPPSNAWYGHPVRMTVKGRPAEAVKTESKPEEDHNSGVM